MIHPGQTTGSLGIEQVIDWILKNGDKYPGKHNTPTERTVGHQKPLEAKAQMLIVWRGLVTYLDQQLRAGRSVNIRGFGAFTFDVDTELPKIANSVFGKGPCMKDLDQARAERKHIHHLKPRFVIDQTLQTLTIRYHNKEQITPAKSQRSIFQKGFRMIYANPVPIAAACQMGKDVVEDTLRTIFLAIKDMLKFDNNIVLQFGFANINFVNKAVKVVFAPYLTQEVKDKDFEQNMRRSTAAVSQTWRTNTRENFFRSSMGTMIRNPNQEVNEALMRKTEALKWMSMDMSSAAKFERQ